MLAAKNFDIVMGVDVHLIQPPGPVPPIPIPHPFIGMLFDPMDFIPFVGASVYVNGIPRAQAGSAGKNLPVHIPIGGTFIKPIGNECEVFMGSATVLVEGSPFARMGMPVLSCQCIGMPSPARKKKKSAKMGFFLPSSVLMAIPAGMPVLIGGPPTIDMMAMAMKGALAGLGKLGKSKFAKKLSGKIHDKAAAAMKKLGVPDSVQNMVHKAICFVTGHPVDVATGKVFTDGVDIELSGPIPFRWERTWYSCSVYEGPLGHGWHHSYDMALSVDEANQLVALRMPDGRPVAFPFVEPGEEFFDRKEKLSLIRDEIGWGIKDKGRLVHRFQTATRDPQVFLLSAIENATGSSIQFSHTAGGLLQSITDSAGRLLQVTNDANGRITEIRTGHLPVNYKLASYHYDSNQNLVEVRDAMEQAMRFEYQGHQLVKETNRKGLSFYFQYDSAAPDAKCLHTWGDDGIYDHKIQYEEGTTTVTNSLGFNTTYVLDGQGLVSEVIDANGNSTYSEYNAYNDLVRETDAAGASTAYSYDERGNQTSVILPDGATYNTLFKDDLPVQASDPVGGTSIWRYNEKGQLVQRIDPDSNLTRFVYQDSRLQSVIDPAGNTLQLDFDKAGNLVTFRLADGSASHWRYDAMGTCVASTDPKGNTQQLVHDRLGNTVQVYEADGNIRFLQYDGEGNVVHAKDNQHDVHFEYRGMNRMAARIEAGTRIEFLYDPEENLTGIKNEHGFPYTFKLDAAGNVAEEIGFDGIIRRYQRDAAGKVTRVVKPWGAVTAYQYDDGGRIVQVKQADGSEERYSYRADGALMTAENEVATILFERDVSGRVLKEVQGSLEVRSIWNEWGNRTGITSSLGADIRMERDIVGDVSKVTAGNGNAAWEATFKRDILGQEIERSLPGGLSNRWERDRLGRPIAHTLTKSGTRLRSKRYTWNVNDRLTAIMDEVKSAGTTFGHDAFGNLAWAKYDDGAFDYKMPDAVGNLFRTQARTDRKYGPAGQLLEANGTRYAYDAEGNLVQKVEPGNKVWNYHWYANGMLKQVVRPDAEAVTFVYDALGRRIGKTFKGQTTRWVWDGNTPLHEWVEDTGQVDWNKSALRVDEKGQLVSQTAFHAEVLQPLTTWLFEADSFIPMAKLVGGTSYSIITDHIGTPVAMYDNNGEATWEAEYDIYGKVRRMFGRKSACPFRYQGQYEDEETGLYYNRFRYYALEEGMYVSQDPIGLNGRFSLYGYVHDLNEWVDVLGLSCTKELRKNINKANRELRKNNKLQNRAWRKEKGSAAHHIVAGDHPRAQVARDILDKYGIDLNSAENGIYLRHINIVSKQPGAYHREIHTNTYFDNVNMRIEAADALGGKSSVLNELEEIQNDLLFNKIIW